MLGLAGKTSVEIEDMAGDNDEANTQRLQSLFGTSSSSFAEQQHQSLVRQLNMPQFRGHMLQNSPNLGIENNGRRAGIPPSHPQIPPMSPYSHTLVNRPGMQNFSTRPGPSHSRSLSQPSFFNQDSLPPLSPSPYRELSSNSVSDHVSADVSMGGMNETSGSLLPLPFMRGNSLKIGESIPLKAHRRSNSDVPFGFMSALQSSPQLMPFRGPAAEKQGSQQPAQLIKKESCWEEGVDGEGTGERKSKGEAADDVFSAYMNLENIDAFNSSATDEKVGNGNREDLDSRASSTKTNGAESSENEATSSSINESGNSVQKQVMSSRPEKGEGLTRSAGGDIAPTTRHYRSVSMDSFVGKINFGDESPKMPPPLGNMPGQLSPTNSNDENSSAFSLEFGNGEFSGAELKKIMANEKLAEIAISDPKRAKRILANRQSAARSKERKTRYIAELEHKVQTLQTEATTLSAQLTLLQRDSSGLNSQNNELKFRLQAMEHQAQLRDALNEALTGEVQRMKLVAAELSREKFQQLSISPQMIQLREQLQQQIQLNMHQMQHQHQQQQSQSGGNSPATSNSNQ